MTPHYTLNEGLPMFRIAHISDLHCGSPYFVPDLMDRAITEINELQPEIVICSGDLTAEGFRPEYADAKAYLDRLDCDDLVVIPGNHDSRNVGYIHFEELFGERNQVVHVNGVSVVAIDSSEPDLDHGHIGRNRYAWRLENIFIVNTGTVSSLRLRGNTRPCYNLIEIEGRHVDVWRKYPYHGQERIIQFSADTLEFEKYTSRIEDEVTSRP